MTKCLVPLIIMGLLYILMNSRD